MALLLGACGHRPPAAAGALSAAELATKAAEAFARRDAAALEMLYHPDLRQCHGASLRATLSQAPAGLPQASVVTLPTEAVRQSRTVVPQQWLVLLSWETVTAGGARPVIEKWQLPAGLLNGRAVLLADCTLQP
jgi:hypothetical protein